MPRHIHIYILFSVCLYYLSIYVGGSSVGSVPFRCFCRVRVSIASARRFVQSTFNRIIFRGWIRQILLCHRCRHYRPCAVRFISWSKWNMHHGRIAAPTWLCRDRVKIKSEHLVVDDGGGWHVTSNASIFRHNVKTSMSELKRGVYLLRAPCRKLSYYIEKCSF